MTKVVDFQKVSDYKTILGMCDLTEKLVKRDKSITKSKRTDKLRRLSRTRAKCLEKLDELRAGEEA